VQMLGWHAPHHEPGMMDPTLKEIAAEFPMEPERTPPGEYCVVLTRAEYNLRHVMDNEYIVAFDIGQVATIARDVGYCLKHLHEKRLVHMDIKPKNFVRVGGRWKLIDLDAATPCGETAGPKWSTAYVCPEIAKVLYPELNSSHSGTMPDAAATMDIWSFGMLLYELCSKAPLFSRTIDDNLHSKSDKKKLCTWKHADPDSMRTHVFADVKEGSSSLEVKKQKDAAIDLISRLLEGEPDDRTQSMSEVLMHDFWGYCCPTHNPHAQIEMFGIAFQRLQEEMQTHCPVIARNFIDRCHTLVTAEPCSEHLQHLTGCCKCRAYSAAWKQAVTECAGFQGRWIEGKQKVNCFVETADHRVVNWDRINGNNGFVCTICNNNISKSIAPQPGDTVYYKGNGVKVQPSTKTPILVTKGIWKDVAIQIAIPHGAKVIQAKVEFPVRQPGCVHSESKTEPKRPLTTVCIAPEEFDYVLRNELDVLLAFIPVSSVKQFKRDWKVHMESVWKVQDLTNLLNLIEATCQTLQKDAAYIRSEIRNSYAHQKYIVHDKEELELIWRFAESLSTIAESCPAADWESLKRVASMRVKHQCANRAAKVQESDKLESIVGPSVVEQHHNQLNMDLVMNQDDLNMEQLCTELDVCNSSSVFAIPANPPAGPAGRVCGLFPPPDLDPDLASTD